MHGMSQLDPFTVAFFTEDSKGLIDKADVPAGVQYTLPKGVKTMHSKGDPLEDLDLVIEAFTGAVGAVILPRVLDITSPMADTTDQAVKLRNLRIGISTNPVRQVSRLQCRHLHSVDEMELL